MSDAWQAPASSGEGAAPGADNQAWTANGHTPSTPPRNGGGARQGRDEDKDRRSRSPERNQHPSSEAGTEQRGRGDGGSNPGNNLHVSGLSHKVDNRELEAVFGKYGKVDRASIMHDPHTRESRGFGFVTMETAEGADAAIAALNGTELQGKNLVIEKARRGRARTPTPGRYFGPPKRGKSERPYDPRPYDSRYARRDDRAPRDYDRRGGGGGYDRDYRRGDDRRYDDRRDDRRYDDRRYDDRRGGDDRRYDRYDDRRYDDRRY